MTEDHQNSAPNSLSDDVQLPLDADIEVEESPSGAPRPVHAQWRFIGLVAVGGAFGTAARTILSDELPAVDGISWSIFGINLVGAFLLGVLLEALAHRGADEGRRRNLRLLLGTGFLGGFTTYSTLAVATAQLIGDGWLGAGVGYGLATVFGGAAATVLGLTVAAMIRPKEEERR